MKWAGMHITPLVALALLICTSADGQQKPPLPERPVTVADPLRVMLEEQGYVAVPLLQEGGEDGCFFIECKSGTETWRMLLDTGAECSSLDIGLVHPG